MVSGCLLLIVVFAATMVVEYLQISTLPFAGFVAVVLALGVTLFLGSLQGLVVALRLRHQPQTDMSQWQDGAQIRVEGVLQATGEPLRGPISHHSALFCDYFGKTLHSGTKQFNGQIPHWRGLLAAPCELRTPSARLQVMGVPSLKEVPISSYGGLQTLQNTALHLATTDWQQVPDLAQLDLCSLQQRAMVRCLHILSIGQRLSCCRCKSASRGGPTCWRD